MTNEKERKTGQMDARALADHDFPWFDCMSHARPNYSANGNINGLF
jgi:hypothetical protein